MQYGKHYTTHPVGAKPSLCELKYLQIKHVGASVWLLYSLHILTSNHCYNTEPISRAQNVCFGARHVL